jgi:hypothetical protein
MTHDRDTRHDLRPALFPPKVMTARGTTVDGAICNRADVPSLQFHSPLAPGINPNPNPTIPMSVKSTQRTPGMPSAFKRYTKWRFIAFSGIGITLLSATAATHLWIEKVEFVPEYKTCLEWQWDVEAERWGQSENGGTDPSLGFTARFGTRSAWLEHYWTSSGTLKLIKTPSNEKHIFLMTYRRLLSDV